MTVIAFRPRSTPRRDSAPGREHPQIRGTFRSPTGGSGRMTGSLRVQRLVMTERGAFVTGVFTGSLRDDGGTPIGIESRRATVPVDLVRDVAGFRPWVRPFELDLMGISVEVSTFALDPSFAFPRLDPVRGRRTPAPPHPTTPAS